MPQHNDDWEVVWSGGPLLPDRPTKPGDTWTRPRRLYNKRAKPRCKTCNGSGMVLYNPGPNQAGEMCPDCNLTMKPEEPQEDPH